MVAAKNTLDRIRLMESERAKKFSGERNAASACLHEVIAALRTIFNAREENKYRAADMLTKVKNLYQRARARVVALCAAEVSELQKISDTFTDDIKVKELKLHTMRGLVMEATKLWSVVAEYRKAVAEDKDNVAFMSC